MKFLLRQQQTISKPVAVEGFGFWSGLDVRIEFRPAPPNHGVCFVRSDLNHKPRIPASVANRIEIPRRTNLAANGTTVEMVEHALAALAGLQIDNCEVWLNRAEAPGCDGSSLQFVDALLSVEQVAQRYVRPTMIVSQTTRIGDDKSWIEAAPNPDNCLTLQYGLDYGTDSPIGRQAIGLPLSPAKFKHELAAARTFILQYEADWLRDQGLGQRVTLNDLLLFDREGPVGNRLRFPDECVRHKTLDLVGDLSLAGCDLQGKITAYRSGHRLNAELVKSLIQTETLISTNTKVA